MKPEQDEERMGILAQVYECAKCGDVWKVSLLDATGEGDMFHFCDACGGDVKEKTVDGIPVMHDLTRSEHEALMSINEEEE